MSDPKVVDPSRQNGWNQTLCRIPGSSFFHTSIWADALRESYRYEPFYLTIPHQSGLEAVLPVMEVDSLITGKRGVSLPFTDYCEPVASDHTQFKELFAAAVVLGRERRWRYLELRGGDRFLGETEPSEWHYSHTLDLTAEGMRPFADATRRNIRKAEKQNLDVSISTSPDAVSTFQRLNAITRRLHGLPAQPRRFFQSVREHILSNNMGFIVLASRKGTAIAANVYFTFGDQLLYKYGASDRTFQHLRASNLVMWEAIKWGRDHGYRVLHLGRTEPGNKGLRQYKAGWGAEEGLIRYYRYDLRKNEFVRTSQAVRPIYQAIFGKLPIPILNLLGSMLYRHMG